MRHSKNQLQSAPWAANPRMIHLRFVNCDCVKDWTARKVLNAKTIGVPFNTLLRYLKSDNLFNGDDGSESEREKETERKKLRARSFSSFFLSSVPIPPTRDSSGCVSSSVTRLDDYRKFLATNSPLKVAQKDCWLLEYFEKDQLIKNCYGYYLGNFWKHLGNFLIHYLVTLVSSRKAKSDPTLKRRFYIIRIVSYRWVDEMNLKWFKQFKNGRQILLSKLRKSTRTKMDRESKWGLAFESIFVSQSEIN